MSEIELKARELLAEEYERAGENWAVWAILNSPLDQLIFSIRGALQAVITALTPPKGCVVVSEGLLRTVASCAYPVSTEIDPRGYAWSEAYLDHVLPSVKAALAAAPPEIEE